MPGSERASNTNYRRRPIRWARSALLNLRATGVIVTAGGLAAAPVLRADAGVGCTVACATAGDLYGSLVGSVSSVVHCVLLVSFSASMRFSKGLTCVHRKPYSC